MKSIYYLELFWYLDRFAKCFFVRYEKYWLSLNGFWSLRRQRFYCKWLIVSKTYFLNYSHVGLCEGFIKYSVTNFIKIIWFEILFPYHNLVFAFCATFFIFGFWLPFSNSRLKREIHTFLNGPILGLFFVYFNSIRAIFSNINCTPGGFKLRLS